MKKANADVSAAVAVLLPCRDKEPSDGLAFIYEGEWARARRVRVMRAYRKVELVKAARENPGWVDFICGVKKLMAAEERPDDRVLIQDAYEKMVPYLGLTSKDPTESFKDAWFLVSGAIAFEGVRLTLWQTKADEKNRKKVLLGLYCPEPKVAIATDMLLRNLLKVCTHCHDIFLAQRRTQTACSIKCREAHRSAKWYALNKRKRALKRRKGQAA